MLLNPRYDGPPILTYDTSVDVLTPLIRQRRRLEAMASRFTSADWATPSRCPGWTVRDVYAHLVSINPFYELSARAGLAGQPSRMLDGFDPAATPPTMVTDLGAVGGAVVLNQFCATNTSFFGAVETLDKAGWDAIAESPPGLVPIRLLCQHALWDSWVHERDICLPLGLTQPVEADEVTACLRYVAGLSPAFGMGAGLDHRGQYAVAATDPSVQFLVTVGESVEVITSTTADTSAPVLRGDTVSLIEALTNRVPLPADAPCEWRGLLNGLRTAWDLEVG